MIADKEFPTRKKPKLLADCYKLGSSSVYSKVLSHTLNLKHKSEPMTHVLHCRWMASNGISVFTARKSSKSRATLFDTSAYTRMKSRTNARSVSGHLQSRAHWQRT